MYRVEMQLIPHVDSIWVAHLKPEDPIYEYEEEWQAQNKAQELQASDTTGRKYRVSLKSV